VYSIESTHNASQSLWIICIFGAMYRCQDKFFRNFRHRNSMCSCTEKHGGILHYVAYLQ